MSTAQFSSASRFGAAWERGGQVTHRRSSIHGAQNGAVRTRSVLVQAVTSVGRDAPAKQTQQLQAPQHEQARQRSAKQAKRVPHRPPAPQPQQQGPPLHQPQQVTRVRVEHDTFIRARRAYIWQLLQELSAPHGRWADAAVVLATLESIYGVEYQSIAEQAITSFQEAARQRVEGGEVGAAPLIAAENYREAAAVRGVPGFGGMELSAPAPPSTGALASTPDDSSHAGELIDVDGDGIPDLKGADNSVMESVEQAEATLAAAQAAADAYFMEIVMLLSVKAHFANVTRRDLRLSDSLNTDLLWQLFVRAYTRRLDADLIAPYLKEKRLPEEARHLLFLKRGYSSESKRGRLLAQKIDYLQVLLLRRIISAAAGAGRQVSRTFKQAFGGQAPQLQAGDAIQADASRDSYGGSSSSSSEEEEGAGGAGRWKGVGRELSRTGHDVRRTLVGWGVLPRTNLIPLEEFDQRYPIAEDPRLAPTYIERVSLPDIVGDYLDLLRRPKQQRQEQQAVQQQEASRLQDDDVYTGPEQGRQEQQQLRQEQAASFNAGDKRDDRKGPQLLRDFFREVMTVEPTFREALVIYRRLPKVSRVATLRAALLGQKPPQPNRWNSPIVMRVYRDIPMPSWQVVFPDKLLQFRPLDLLRTDLFALVGVVSAVANSKYSSAVLQAVTLVTVGIALSRLVLGFLRMSDRYRGIVSDLLRERTIASQEGAIEYLSASASLQQFKQCALAYTLLAVADQPLTEEQLATQAEQLLKQRLNLVVRFDAAEALSELERFGVLIEHGANDADGTGSDAAWSSASTNGSTSTDGSASGSSSIGSEGDGGARYSVVSGDEAKVTLETHWANLLSTRVAQIMDAFDES